MSQVPGAQAFKRQPSLPRKVQWLLGAPHKIQTHSKTYVHVLAWSYPGQVLCPFSDAEFTHKFPLTKAARILNPGINEWLFPLSHFGKVIRNLCTGKILKTSPADGAKVTFLKRSNLNIFWSRILAFKKLTNVCLLIKIPLNKFWHEVKI